ncbi:MAG: methionyl-tRNA formyltransferase [Pseudomonadales bacterium]|nr:methionyl-tRNA formyltransferase [Pseudomonadales bacterium]
MNPSKPKVCSLRIIFSGTPDFAAVSLAALLDSPHQVIAVYTQPDRPAGRGRQLTASPVKQLALQHHIPVYQPSSLKNSEAVAQLKALDADLMVVAAYGIILPPIVLEIPKYGCINIHASLLPRWRGAAPIQHAILAGDIHSGITIMQMDAGLDTGDILLKAPCDITPEDTGSSLHDRLAKLGAQTLLSALADLPSTQAQAQKQDDSQACYASKLEKQQARIDWSLEAQQLSRQVRAFNAWPVAFSELGDQRVRIWQAQALDESSSEEPGTIIKATAAGIDVACGKGILRLLKIQLPGAKALAVGEVLKAKIDYFCLGTQFTFA